MSQAVQSTHPAVPPEEIARRIAEYRRLGFEHRSPAMMVYPPAQHKCPWPDCNIRIAGFRLNLEVLGDAVRREQWLGSWWQGPGLVGRCPGCGRYVLFGYEEKHAVPDPSAFPLASLPDNWADESLVSLHRDKQ